MKLSNSLLFLILFHSLVLASVPKSTTTFRPPPEISKEEKNHFQNWLVQFEKNEPVVEEGEYLNELVFSQSPYLRQHIFNPINWKAWNPELLKRAKSENKLIFLSIGYSTCHWCHVMAKESFSDLEVARVLNKNFFSIKVDREELPHIDDYYTSALEQVKGTAGWPITVIITGDGLPVFIDSYLSREKLLKLLYRINTIWKQQPDFLLSTANTVNTLVKKKFNTKMDIDSSEKKLSGLNTKLLESLDAVDGGFRGEVKFPSEAMLLYGLDQLKREKNLKLETAIKLQLDKMISGGLYDHVEGGFHRYSTDSNWIVPHFEKMLYNQAQLILVYSRAFEYFRDPAYKEIVSRTTEFMLSRFYLDNKGFITALDADFNGIEGGYYLFNDAELSALTNSPQSYKTYQVKESQDKGIIFSVIVEQERLQLINNQRKKLALARQKKGQLHSDNKILTSWNALASQALVAAGELLNRNDYIELAKKITHLLWTERYMESTGFLSRTGFDSNKIKQAYLEDYAFLSDALIVLYDQSDNEEWLHKARTLSTQAIKLFFDSSDGGFYNNFQHSGIHSLKKTQDGELLSSSAVMVDVLSKIDLRTGKKSLKNKYQKTTDFLQSKLTAESLTHLYSAYILKRVSEGVTQRKRYFAKSKGNVEFNCKFYIHNLCQQMIININLKEGWHINSMKPLQDYLQATKLKVSEGFKVIYPKDKLIKLGFQDQPLSVYEGNFTISINRLSNNTDRVFFKLPLQACSDIVCLLPETYLFDM